MILYFVQAHHTAAPPWNIIDFGAFATREEAEEVRQRVTDTVCECWYREFPVPAEIAEDETQCPNPWLGLYPDGANLIMAADHYLNGAPWKLVKPDR